MNNHLSYTINKGICILDINRPPVNALSYDLLTDIKLHFKKFLKLNKIRCIIITSSNNHFSAGADLKERKIMSKKESSLALDNFNNCFNEIENFPHPVICAINGYCLGGGAELSLACDFRIASTDAIIGFPEVSIGIIPGAGGTQRLPKIIGISNAKYWIYTAKKFNAKEAYEYGFLNFLVPKKDLLTKCIDIANVILNNAPISICSSKNAINNGYNDKILDGLIKERNAYNIALNSKDRDEALAAFFEKRKPKWRNK